MKKPQISLAIVIALATAGLFLTVISAGVLSSSQTMASSGTISGVNVGVYNDAACTQNCTAINWGNVAPGTTVTRTVYIKNTGNIQVILTMATSGWAPSIATYYLTQAWDRSNYALAPGAVTSAVLSLTAGSGAGVISTFSYSITITGTQ